MSIDFFARSLAEDLKERSIFVLLSGADSDGTLGIRAVRGAGGLTIAQDQTAQFGQMPRSAVATGLVDLILPPEEMPKAIAEYLRRSYVRGERSAAGPQHKAQPRGLTAILEALRNQTGHDFRNYKQSTVLRRIERRMGLRGTTEIDRYSDLLVEEPSEIKGLDTDLLINVTAFFRDAEAFEELRQKAIVPLVESKQSEDVIRVWVPGCSSGEEAYSVAMLLSEEIATAQKHCNLQVFATDIDEEALQTARAGTYPESIVADVTADRLARFFIKQERNFYTVTESLRSHLVFAVQNLITDPPFSRMDMISCRNLLIYVDADTQNKLIPLFNYSLNVGGYLFLGKSEGIGAHDVLFKTVSKKARIYRRLIPARHLNLDYPTEKKKAMPNTGVSPHKPPVVSYPEIIRQTLLTHFAASVVLVDRKGQILQFHGQTGKYLNMPTGDPTLNLLDVAKKGLSLKIRSALHQAVSQGKTVVMDNVQLIQNESTSSVRVTAVPVLRDETEPLISVLFEDVTRPAVIYPEPDQSGNDDTVVKQLEDELRATQRDLQSTIEDLQVSNEELRVANQEVIATNEELQSTNEELETSKEELQSVNEELTTVNNELQEKVETLNKANSDMTNFLSSTQIATLFLDGELRIKLFTPAATRVFRLIPSDVGRPISDMSLNLVDYDLPSDVHGVEQSGSPIEREVLHTDGSFYLIRIMPYRTPEDNPDGLILTFSDVTSLRRAEEQTRRLATAVRAANDAVILFNLNGMIEFWNSGAETMYGWREAEVMKKNLRDIVPADRFQELFDSIRNLKAGETISSFESQRLTRDGGVLDIWLTAAPVVNSAGKVEAFATVERDITDRKRAEKELKTLNEALEKRAEQLRFLASELTLAEQHEQHRLAQILHDGLQQILVGAKFQVALLEHNKDVPQVAAAVTNLIDEAINTSRSLTAELGPPILHRAGLIPGLKWLVDWMNAKYGFRVDLAVPETLEQLPESVFILLFQAARELLFNVVKHAGVKSAHVEVKGAEGFIQLIVEDKGAGFDTSTLTAGTNPKGIGLLSLRERLNMLGGSMDIDSSPGSGSRFLITMPYSLPTEEILRATHRKQETFSRIAEFLKIEGDGLPKIGVLLADDHTIVRQGLANLIKAEQDMEVVGEASDGESAVKIARKMQPDVVLMDINMPGMNGIDATRIIHQELPMVRVIGLSMFREGEQAAAMREAGAADYIDKSGPSDALLSAIRKSKKQAEG